MCVCVFTTSAPLYSERHVVKQKISGILLFLIALLFGMERWSLILRCEAIKIYAGEKHAMLTLK